MIKALDRYILMLFAIYAIDKSDALPKRMANYGAHRAHIDDAGKYGVSVIMSGPLVTDDGKTPIGSLFLIEAPDRQAAEAFNKSDPFNLQGIWEKVDIRPYIKKRG